MNTKQTLLYTKTDEAPALATHSFLPILERFLKGTGVNVESVDISLAARILARFGDVLSQDQQVCDELAKLGELVSEPDTTIIKLPNISASVPQLKDAIKELQQRGFAIPDYPDNPRDDQERDFKQRYSKVLGSAVNPVLREGNSDRRVAQAVKDYARKNPHSMGRWSPDSRTRVASMAAGDFYGSELSYTAPENLKVDILFQNRDGSEERPLRPPLTIQKSEIIDGSVMSRKALQQFFRQEMDRAKDDQMLLSLHLKATMMKVSDPAIFGCALETLLEPLKTEIDQLGFDPRQGLKELESRIDQLPDSEKTRLQQALNQCLDQGPRLAMVDSDRGITNFHVPSDVIVDASMPAAIRLGGKMWDKDGKAADTVALIPDRCYAGIFQSVIDDCKAHGAYDVATMGNVANIGLMAKKAEEYGSHDKTFILTEPGTVKVVASTADQPDGTPQIIWQFAVEKGDIWRMCQTKDIAIKDWVRLAVERARLSQTPAIFWLDSVRAHDRALREKVQTYLIDHDLRGLTVEIKDPLAAMTYTLNRLRAGQNTISVTGNVLRDYLTDLFPILELGTSAKMLSIVPLLAGGGLFETGAGGSAPKHVQQLLEEGHLRWDSLGEFLALGAALQDWGEKHQSPQVCVLAQALDQANSQFLAEDKSPSRKVGERDTRGSHFYLALYWAEALASQSQDSTLGARFKPLASFLRQNLNKIEAEMLASQGQPQNIGGYYLPDDKMCQAVMRPSPTFNQAIATL